MFAVGFVIGIYGYLILFLGFAGLLKSSVILVLTLIYFLFLVLTRKAFLTSSINPKEHFSLRNLSEIEKLSIFLLVVLFLINLLGALAPEYTFDATWYHLTLPKLYKSLEAVIFVPGGLLYYSVMPKLTELLYTASLFIPFANLPKLIHLSFGLLTAISLYFIAKDELGRKAGILTVVVFYSNIVVAWESTTAYIDLARTFFELMTFWGMVLWIKTKKTQWLVESSLMLGLAISTKLLALTSLPLLLFILLLASRKESLKVISKRIVLYCGLSILVVLPWLVFAYIHTGNPVYPFFSDSYSLSSHLHLLDIATIFMKADDPISPLYLIVFPLSLIFYKKLPIIGKYVLLYSLGSLVVWFFTPRTGGGRFLLPYLPVMSFLVIYTLSVVKEYKIVHKTILVALFTIAFITIGYRGLASIKFLPVVFGLETKEAFLTKHLNFSFGDFYDTDGYFKKTITKDDRVLLYGFHNLYYVDFPYIHESWVKKGDSFNYIAVQSSGILPERFKGWPLVYENNITHVRVYSIGKGMWIY